MITISNQRRRELQAAVNEYTHGGSYKALALDRLDRISMFVRGLFRCRPDSHDYRSEEEQNASKREFNEVETFYPNRK